MDLTILAAELRPAIAACGYELYDLALRKERKMLILSVVIDKPDGIDIDDCVAVSDLVNPILDRLDPVEGEYNLEVTSPGAERRLRNPAEVAAAIGRFVHVVHDGVKTEGTLVAATPETLTMKVGTKQVVIATTTVTLIRLAIQF